MEREELYKVWKCNKCVCQCILLTTKNTPIQCPMDLKDENFKRLTDR